MGRKQKGYAPLLRMGGWLLTCCLTLELVNLSTPYLADGLSVLTMVSASMQDPAASVSYLQETAKQLSGEPASSEPATESDNTSEPEEAAESKPAEEESESKAEEALAPLDDTSALVTVEEPETVPERGENTGDVDRRVVGGTGSSPFVDLEYSVVKNLSELSDGEVAELAQEPLELSFTDTDEPQVLIYHTHATESYLSQTLDWYDLDYTARSTDDSKNMVAVGDALTAVLEAGGIAVIHDTTQFDNPSYTEGYDRSRAAVEEYLEQYPSIKVVLDVHRDAIQSDTTITAPVCTIDGQEMAQLMVVACADDGDGELPNYKENFIFGAHLNEQLEQDFPGITRPMLFCERIYNQDLSTGSLLVEVGGHGNSLKDAVLAVQKLGYSLLTLLKSS